MGLAVRPVVREAGLYPACAKEGGVAVGWIRRGGAVVAACAITLGGVAGVADARIPLKWRSCKAVNARYHHGIGRFGAHDITKSGDPVTNFFHSTRLYNTAIGFNKGLDRDKDGIACEKA